MMTQESDGDSESHYAEAERLIDEARYEAAPELDLSHLRALDKLPSALRFLLALKSLRLSDTLISDLSPVAGLVSLKHLFLDRTRIRDLGPISRLDSIETLILDETDVSDISPLFNLGSLTVLSLSGTDVSQLTPLGGAFWLRRLFLDRTSVLDLSPIAGLEELEILDISDSDVFELAPLSQLRNLVDFRLERTAVSNLNPIREFSVLHNLSIDDTEVSDLSPLSKLFLLERLSLDGTRVTSLLPLRDLTNLKYLSFDNVPVSDLSPISNLTRLASRGGGLECWNFNQLPDELQKFSKFLHPERTLKTLNYLRQQQGLPLIGGDSDVEADLMQAIILRLLDAELRPHSVDEICDYVLEEMRFVSRRRIVRRLGMLASKGLIRRVLRGIYASIDYVDMTSDYIEDGETLPDIPEQKEGPSFGITSNGKIGFLATGLVSDADDVALVEAMRTVLLQALDDLFNATKGTNAFTTIHRVALNYREVLSSEVSAISIDLLYAQGVRLDNARSRLAIEMVRGDAPDAGVLVGEALDSVIALHGPVVLSTKRGRTLLELSRQYNENRTDELAYKERASEFARSVVSGGGTEFVERAAIELVESVNLDVAEGRFPERSTDLSRRVNNNFFVTLARVALENVVKAGVVASVPGVFGVGVTAELVNAVSYFVVEHGVEMCALAAVAGPELSWFASFYAWWQRQRFLSQN